MKFYDAHIHWQDKRLASSFNEDWLASHNLGIDGWICAGTFPQDWADTLNLHKLHPEIIPAFGLHPWYLESHISNNDWKTELKNYHLQAQSIFGEIGLDYMVEVPREKQREAFIFQWRLALDLDRPVVVHCRKAYEELLGIIKYEGTPYSGFLLHSYSGSLEQIESFSKLGAFFSVSGNITTPNNKKARLNAQQFPLDRLLIETDAPAMNPFIDGKKWEGVNRAQNLIAVFNELCALKNMEESTLSSILEFNFKKFCGTTYSGIV